jgi:tetratricopeptide (TPR) repeat protein
VCQRRPQEALNELHAVNARAPKEAAVYAALGRAYRSIGNLQNAVVHWTIALDLDPKDRGRVKNMMDRACKHENEEWNSDQDDEGDADDEGILHDSDFEQDEQDEQDGDQQADEEQGDEPDDEYDEYDESAM